MTEPASPDRPLRGGFPFMAEPGPIDRPPSPPGAEGPAPARAPVPHLMRGFLFADLRDYTRYVETHGDHAGAKLLDRYKALVREAIAGASGEQLKTLLP